MAEDDWSVKRITRAAGERGIAMENRVLGLLGGSFLLLAVGVGGSLVYFGDPPVLMVSIILVIVGALGMHVAWALRGIVPRLGQLERERDGAVSAARVPAEGPSATTGRPLE
jgi:hypothetical protein